MQEPIDTPGARPTALSVSGLTAQLKSTIEGRFSNVSVEGEVISARRVSSGHMYLTLKDGGAQLPAVIWRSTLARLSTPIEDGQKVIATGDVQVYPPHGRYQLVIKRVVESGTGDLLAQLEVLKRRLHAEGLFDPDRKQPLPMMPRCVGVATARTGAALQDIIRTIHARSPTRVLVYPCQVQGKGAAESIAHAINGLGAHPDVDVIIAGRGGGSLQDLWAFNEEVLLRAIANCNVPVISAVGHEIDTPLSDLVADARATTPTAAGELAVQKFEDLQFTLVHHTEKLHRALSATIGGRRDALKSLEGRLGDPLRLVAEQHQALDDLSGGLTRAMREAIVLARERRVRASARLRNLHPSTRIQMAQSQLRALRRRCTGQGRMLLEQRRRRLSELGHSLDLLSPAANLERGYAIVRDDQGRVLQHAEDVSKGDGLSVILHRGTLDVQVETVHPESDLEQ